MEKFPKSSLEFFELFLARAKGVFNTDFNRLKSEKRNFEAELESKSKLLREQESLFEEK